MTLVAYHTAIDLPINARETLVCLLNQQLADALDLGMQFKHAHWNVKGPQFFSLHELFDSLAEELEDYIDDIAERTVELGGVAGGTLQVVARDSRLVAYAPEVAAGRAHCLALSRAIATYGASTRAAIDSAARVGDADTADLFTEVSRGLDKMLWKVEAHLHGDT